MTKQDEILINRDNINIKYKKIINLLDKTLINEINKKKNNDVEFKSKRKKIISFEIVITTNEKK